MPWRGATTAIAILAERLHWLTGEAVTIVAYRRCWLTWTTRFDRAGAFDRWAREFAWARGGGAAGAEWLVAADRDGLESRERLAAKIGERYELDGHGEAWLLAELRGGLVRQLVLDPAVSRALRGARDAGWTPSVVTNGTVAQQRKLRHTGLDREVAGWVISARVGLRKPDPAIFRLAAARARQPLPDAWMIGDSPTRISTRAPRGSARNLAAPRPSVAARDVPARASADSFRHAVDILLDHSG